jgi:hypothetical protein
MIGLAIVVAQALVAAPTPRPIEVTLHGGAMQFAERGKADKRDFVSRLMVTLPAPASITAFGRIDWTRTQDGGNLFDVQTFRSVECFVGARRDLGQGFAATAFIGGSWDRDSKITPEDPRLYTLAGGLRYDVSGRGYAIVAVGHHGPVGGPAVLGSLVYEIGDGSASYFADVSIPLSASQFASRPYTVKAGISARVKSWRIAQ